MKVYVAGPYTPHDGREETRLENVRRASEVAQQLLRAGHIPFCPHTMTAGWEATCGYDDFLRLGFEWLADCDAILLLPGWETSRGAILEKAEADRLGIPAYVWEDAISGLRRLDSSGDWVGTARQASADQHLSEVRSASSETPANQPSKHTTESAESGLHRPFLLLANNDVDCSKGNDGGGTPRPTQVAEVEPAQDGAQRALPTADQYTISASYGRAVKGNQRCR